MNACVAERFGQGVHTDQGWNVARIEVMELIKEAKVRCVLEYECELLTANKVIAEAAPDDNNMSCGRSKEHVMLTAINN